MGDAAMVTVKPMVFIRLTCQPGNLDVWVDITEVCAVKESDGGCSGILLKNGQSFDVVEAHEDIMNRIKNSVEHYNKPPS